MLELALVSYLEYIFTFISGSTRTSSQGFEPYRVLPFIPFVVRFMVSMHSIICFLYFLNHPNMMSNFHHHHFQKIQVMHQYHFVTEDQDAL
jgi:hypothetical protein